jgi:N-acetylglucosaminyldiphosphoundecaprenol N-acetyl-beta-D-mannosaminyltransferase
LLIKQGSVRVRKVNLLEEDRRKQGFTPTCTIIDVRVEVTSYVEVRERVTAWCAQAESCYVCLCNVHMVMEAHDDPAYRNIVNQADLTVPDGMPLVWALRMMGEPQATRVYGPRLMAELCSLAMAEHIPVGLYGSTPPVLAKLRAQLQRLFPDLAVVYAHSPPFRDSAIPMADTEAIRRSGARIIFVGLGCPKQERWMAAHRGVVPAVMVGVGAAFDFLAGTKRQAPGIMQRTGFEWAFRLATEPRRLWRRYAVHNPRFMALVTRQILRHGKVDPR